jgi:hypothetical protein
MRKCLNILAHEKWMGHYLHQMWLLAYEGKFETAMYSHLMYLHHLSECTDGWRSCDREELDLFLSLSGHAIGLGDGT